MEQNQKDNEESENGSVKINNVKWLKFMCLLLKKLGEKLLNKKQNFIFYSFSR
jgi:hypothetical protein